MTTPVRAAAAIMAAFTLLPGAGRSTQFCAGLRLHAIAADQAHEVSVHAA